MKKKKVKKMFIAFVGIFIIIYHGCWVYNFLLYTKFTEGMEETKKFSYYDAFEDGYIYDVMFPAYLYFTGNLAVSAKVGDNDISLLIWPSRFKKTEFGVMLPAVGNSIQSIMIDKNGIALEEYEKQATEEYKEEIENLFQKASERWGEDFDCLMD